MIVHVSETVVLSDADVQERFVRAQGARGQNPKHQATAVELRYDVTHADIPDDVKTRLMRLAGRHITPEGVLVITSRAFPTQHLNRGAAHDRLLRLLLKAACADGVRKPTRPRRDVRARRLANKRTRGEVKHRRGSTCQDGEGE